MGHVSESFAQPQLDRCAARVRSATCAIRRRVKFRFSRRSLSSLPASTDRSPSAITGTFLAREERLRLNARGDLFVNFRHGSRASRRGAVAFICSRSDTGSFGEIRKALS